MSRISRPWYSACPPCRRDNAGKFRITEFSACCRMQQADEAGRLIAPVLAALIATQQIQQFGGLCNVALPGAGVSLVCALDISDIYSKALG